MAVAPEMIGLFCNAVRRWPALQSEMDGPSDRHIDLVPQMRLPRRAAVIMQGGKQYHAPRRPLPQAPSPSTRSGKTANSVAAEGGVYRESTMTDYWLSKLFFDLQSPAAAAA